MNRVIPLTGTDRTLQLTDRADGPGDSPATENENPNSPEKKSPPQSILKNKFRSLLLNKVSPEAETNQSSTQRLRDDEDRDSEKFPDAESHAKAYTSGLRLPGVPESPKNKDEGAFSSLNNDQKKGGLFSLIKKKLPDLTNNTQLKLNLMK